MLFREIVIAGCGNPLYGDDGFGPAVVEELKKLQLPDNVKVIDAGLGAPHFLFTLMEDAEVPVKKLIIIDIAQPRDVEDEVRSIEGVHLFTIDDLRGVNEAAMDSRRDEADRARAIIDEEVDHFIRLLRRTAADETLALLYTWAESIRTRERDRALARLGKDDDRTKAIIDDLTRVLTKKLLSDVTISIRSNAECGNIERAESLVRAITRGELCFHNDE